MDWQPIETAPRDGAWFLIIREQEGEESIEVGCYDPLVTERYEPAGNGLFRQVNATCYEWRGFNNFHRATHWMPLPPPPQDGSTEGRG